MNIKAKYLPIWSSDINDRYEFVIEAGTSRKWICFDFQANIGLLRFRKDKVKVNVYLTTMTVSTCMNHKKKGKTQLFRKSVSPTLLETIFDNPRIHTNKGYYEKDNV